MKTIITNKGREFSVMRINNDVNGNPRYVIHWLSLDLKRYEATKLTRAAGLRLHNTKAFGGGFSFQSYSLPDTLDFIYDTVNPPVSAKDKLKTYILEAIDFEGRAQATLNLSEKERLQEVYKIFIQEYGHNIKRYGEQKAFENWLQGLPSCFHIAFENHKILQLSKEFGFLPEDASERQEDRALSQWWGRIYMAFKRFSR